jgi:glutamate---cysteine ligase / carboxylate-amine ligase
VGDSQRLSPEEQLRVAREQFEEADDFSVAVEEEFAILDPDTLSLTNRFEELQALAAGTEVEDHLVGELIASEVEIRTGRADTFADIVARIPERRQQLRALTDKLGVTLGGTGTHPWSPWQEQRIIDTPHYRRNDEILRYVVWRNNSFGLHVHVAINGLDRVIKVTDALRVYLPELLAFSASSPFVENVNTDLHSARTQIFTRFFPRCGIPDAYGDWATFESYVRFLYETGSIDEHTQMWWSVRPHLAFPTVEIRVCDAQPLQEEAIALAALAYSLTVRIARALDEGEPLLLPEHRFIEENFWRAIRHGLSGEMIDLHTARVRPTRSAIEELIEWVQPVAGELGTAEYLIVPEANAAERQRARHAEGATLKEIYAEQVGPEAPLAVPPSGRTGLARASVGTDRSTQLTSKGEHPSEPVGG